MSKPGIRLSAEPLMGALAANGIDPEYVEGRLNAAIRKGKFNGFFTLAMADEIACNILKMHPVQVWGEEYENKVWFDSEDAEEMAMAA